MRDEPENDVRPATARDTTGLIGDALTHVSNLVRSEVDLARAEVSENVKRAGVAIGLLVAAMVVALVALNVLAAALTAAIAELGLDAGWAALIVGGGLALIALIMVMKGMKDLKLSSLAPTRTAKNVRRDADVVKEHF
ncbi:hypothetical protein JSE7799_01671 [Jannaschia seosinensis]|uniref:Phage holin family protein n=1 Tax=Jannaschia seosinensis TaxID=313367 RepID=A0A0M7BAV9_9RHOB|nr:phage holin family protein [Jannaschia seosinensis]CUH38952.1 hypothetical protein JSE7799_01671 [Jannaschia seosinensis]